MEVGRGINVYFATYQQDRRIDGKANGVPPLALDGRFWTFRRTS